MKIAIASGKGGTGKTMVTASLAATWGKPVVAVDLDVEEPNLHLFVKPEITGSRLATIEVPVVDESKCTFCRECAELCEFKAISILGSVALVFPEMCHGCGGCMAVCPTDAISSGSRTLGEVSWGNIDTGGFMMGRLRVGEAMSPPLIRDVLAELMQAGRFDSTDDVLLDSPPGVSCPAVAAVIESDVIVLVTEPTPFGLFDLRLAHKAFAPLNKPMGVVVNRAGLGSDDVYGFCQEAGLPIFAQIPYDRKIAEAYAGGRVIAHSSQELATLFTQLADTIRQAAQSNREARHA